MDEQQRRASQHPALLLDTLEHLLAIDVTDRPAALTQMSQLLSEGFGADKVDIMVFQEDINSLVALGTSQTPMGYRQRALGIDRLPLVGEGREVEVYRTGTPYLTDHADRDPKQLPELTAGLGIRSAMIVPLEVARQRRGVVLASSATPERFGQQELALFEAAARWVGVVVHRAELVERNREQAREQGRRMAADDLVTIVAHDLRNYLTPIKARIALIHRRAQRRNDTRDMQDAEVAAGGIERLSRLIANLLDASRVEQGLFALDLQPMDLVAMMRELADALSVQQTPIRVKLPTHLDELVVIADPDRVRQALENLLANALRHSPPGTQVTLALDLQPVDAAPAPATQGTQQGAAEPNARGEVSGGAAPQAGTGDTADTGDTDTPHWAVVSVADRGPGIAPEMLPRLFTRFARGPNSSGLGLGLYLVQQIARAHGGRLMVESTPGEGARFRLMLPVAGPPT